jgi:hypothetical protein
MNERTIAAAEQALVDFLNKARRDRDYFKGRLIKAEDLPKPNQHMIAAAMNKLSWYAVEINELEGELEMLREELEQLGAEADIDPEEEQGGEETEN